MLAFFAHSVVELALVLCLHVDVVALVVVVRVLGGCALLAAVRPIRVQHTEPCKQKQKQNILK